MNAVMEHMGARNNVVRIARESRSMTYQEQQMILANIARMDEAMHKIEKEAEQRVYYARRPSFFHRVAHLFGATA